MLISMQVRDFAIVDRISVEFESGMTVLTGETGAGKSILVDALGLVLGERGNAQLVRSGAKRAEFSAAFDISKLPHVRSWLDEQSLDEDDECLLRRVINADGRSRAFINGNAVPVQQLKSVGELLVDIHGQHFHQSLARRPVQRDLLDYYGGLVDERDQTSAAFVEWQALAERLRKILDADGDRASRLDLLTFQLQELQTLNLGASEAEELVRERQRLSNSGRLAEGAALALTGLFDDDSSNANKLVAEAARSIEGLVEFDEELRPVVAMLESAGIQIAEAADTLRRHGESIDMDPARRDWVEERLDAIQSLSRKHRVNADELPELQQKLERELDELNNADERGRELEEKLAAASSQYMKLANALSTKRHDAAKKLSDAVTDAMHGLGMPGGEFEIRLTTSSENQKESEARAHGLDAIEFQITANPGQPKMPLSKVASGGELSRMSLAIQVIASDGSAIPTMVFDEVDSGVGGGVAEKVGRRLAELGTSRQVLCVTHLPQVASLAAQHFRISKVTDGKATRTNVQALGNDERIDELARMLGGIEITKKTLDHAAEMLSGAPKKRA
jgi:DNA repair protein RecN (Recombination protein N)